MNEISRYERSFLRCCQVGSERLTRYLSSLPPESWQSPSACEKWEVRDVVGHLAWGAKLYISAISRGIQGINSTQDGYPPEGKIERETFPVLAAQQAIAYRKRQGEQ